MTQKVSQDTTLHMCDRLVITVVTFERQHKKTKRLQFLFKLPGLWILHLTLLLVLWLPLSSTLNKDVSEPQLYTSALVSSTLGWTKPIHPNHCWAGQSGGKLASCNIQVHTKVMGVKNR